MEPAEIRDKFARQLGPERFEEFSTQLRINLRKRPKLNYWHEQEWRKFCNAHPECAELGLGEICEIFWTEEMWNRPGFKPEVDPNLLSIELIPPPDTDEPGV